jgi:translocation and assembly module TamB
MRKRQALWLLTPPLLIIVALSALWSFWAKEKLISYAMSQIPSVNQMQDVVDIKVNRLEISLLKLQARAVEVEFQFKNDLKHLDYAVIENIKLQIDPFNLLVGQLSASYVQLNAIKWYGSDAAFKKFFLSSSGPQPEINLEPVFKLLPEIPIQNIYIADTILEIKLPESSEHALKKLGLNILNLKISNKVKTIEVMTPKITVSATSDKNITTAVDLNLFARLDETSIKKLNAEIIKNDSQINISFTTDKLKTLLINPEVKSSIKARLKLDELRNVAYTIKKTNSRIPQASGSVSFSTSIKTEGLSKNSGDIYFAYNDINIDALKFGSGEFKSKIKNNSLDIDNVKLEHPSGLATLNNINIENQPPYKFKTDLVINQFDLQKLFLSLNLTEIPAYLTLKATAHCEGQLSNFVVNCKTDLNADDVIINADMKKTTNIVTVKKIKAHADVTLNAEEVIFGSAITLNNSSFAAKGRINFKEGFNLTCEGENFKLEDIDNLANLKLKGTTKGKLTTHGDSNFGVIQADLKIDQAGIDGFELGNVSTLMNYKEAVISLTQMQGLQGESQYRGQVDVDLNKSETRGSFNFEKLKVTDALSMIEEKWHLPIDATGNGSATVSFHGPLDFWKLKMQINLALTKGALYGESFTKLNGQLESDGSKLNFNYFRMMKTSGYVELRDHIDTTKKDPVLNLTIASSGLKADDIDHLGLFFRNVTGDVHVNGKITGPLDDAKIITQSQLNNFQIENMKLPHSQLESELNKRFFHASGQIFGRQIQTEFNIPFAAGESYAITAKINNFQPLLLLPMIGLPLPNYDIKSNLSGQVDIKTTGNSFDHIHGKVSIDQFSLERGSQTLRLTSPSEMIFKDELTSMSPMNFTGPDQNLSIKIRKQNGEQKVYINGRLFLKPIQFLAPFTESLSGIIEFVTYVQFKNGRPDFSGEGLINDASFSASGFPYPITNTSAFFNLRHSKIELTEITGSVNQSRLYGEGRADIKGPKNVAVNINIETEEVELEFPSRVFTTGLAKVSFFGDWLPYTLKIDYDVSQGLMTKEFTGGTDDSASVLPLNSLLPISQLDQNSQGLLLDAHVKFPKGIVVKNSMLEGVLTGFLNVAGTPSLPVYTGVINLQPGSKINFKDKQFEIQNGLVRFNGIKEMNPEVSVSANARVTDYDVNLTVNGPAKKLDIKATSQPALSENDIFSLLALGYTSSSTDQSVSQNLSSDTQQKQTGLEVLSVLGNQSDFTKKIQSRLGLNVQLAPSVDSTRNIAVPKVIVSKKLGKKLNTSYSRSLTGDRQNNEVKLQWMFTPNSSAILNYQSSPNIQQDNNIIQNQDNEIGVGGIDYEFKKEFQW